MNTFRLLVLTSAVCLLTGLAHAQTELKSLNVSDPRPVEAAVLSLISRFPVVITYEDPQYEYTGDVQDLTEQVRKQHPNAHGIIAPRGGTLHANYEVSQETGDFVNVAGALENIVNAKNVNAVGGRFTILQIGDVFHVIPTEIRDSTGAWIKQTSILDVPITLKTDELNGADLLDAILKKVSEASGKEVSPVIQSFLNTFLGYSGSIEAKDEPARDVLLKALHAISERFAWVLNYVPVDHDYVFAVTLVAAPPAPEAPSELPTPPRPGEPTPTGPHP